MTSSCDSALLVAPIKCSMEICCCSSCIPALTDPPSAIVPAAAATPTGIIAFLAIFPSFPAIPLIVPLALSTTLITGDATFRPRLVNALAVPFTVLDARSFAFNTAVTALFFFTTDSALPTPFMTLVAVSFAFRVIVTGFVFLAASATLFILRFASDTSAFIFRGLSQTLLRTLAVCLVSERSLLCSLRIFFNVALALSRILILPVTPAISYLLCNSSFNSSARSSRALRIEATKKSLCSRLCDKRYSGVNPFWM